MKRKKIEQKKASQEWLITYSDMTTLLLVFFIAIIATSDIKEIKTRVILSTFVGNIGFLGGGKTLAEEEFVNFGKEVQSLPSSKLETKLEKATSRFSSLFSPFIENKRIRVVETQEGIVISLFSDVFFEANSARVKYSAVKDVLKNLNILLSSDEFNGKILVEGHTDNVPYYGTEFKDNWELSVERALSVLQVIRSFPFIKRIKEDRISVHGYGSTKPIEDNNNPLERAFNRRVDIILKRN